MAAHPPVTVTATGPAPAPGRGARTGPDLPDRLGWALLAALTLLVFASWTPAFAGGLGDDHEGRILSRHALAVANAERDGLAGSDWLSDWSPYRGGEAGEQERYAHHPPLLNLGYWASAQVSPLPLDTTVRLFSYLTGIAALPLGAAVLRRLRFGWWPVLAATTAVAVTPLFWVYGRLNGAVSLLLAMVLVVVRLREDRPIGTGELVVAAAVSCAAVVAGYLGLATAAVLGLWLLARRGIDRVTVVVGAAMALGAAITLAYVVGNTGGTQVASQVEMRTRGGGFTTSEFVARIRQWATELLPGWWRWGVLPVAVAAGLADRRTRLLTAATGAIAVGWIVGLPNGSFIHDYWIFPVLLPVWWGVAAAVAWVSRWRLAAGPVAVLVVGVAGGLHLDASDVPSRYVTEPARAGTLVREVGPGEGQAVAWRTAGLAAPRWLSFYWDLPPAVVGAGEVDDVPADELVLVRLDRVPGWLDAEAATDGAEQVLGRYAVLTGDALRTAAD